MWESLVNPPAWGAGDRRFESDHPDCSIDRDVLLGEQCDSNPHAEGSTPSVLAHCPVTLRVWRPVCHAGETGSGPVQGVFFRAGDWAVRQPSDTRFEAGSTP